MLNLPSFMYVVRKLTTQSLQWKDVAELFKGL